MLKEFPDSMKDEIYIKKERNKIYIQVCAYV